jgi:RNA methyltransferase, TrmH family
VRRQQTPAGEDQLVARFRHARRDPSVTVLEGFHALKHALRFGAELVEAVATDAEELEHLAGDLAPDLLGAFADVVAPVTEELLSRLAPHAPRTGVMAIARRPRVDVQAVLDDERPAPIVFLEDPRDMRNMGACVRVAAAADAAGVLTIGHNDPWHPDAVRGAAGLHYAVPVARVAELPRSNRPVLAIDPDGAPLRLTELPPRAVLAFGTERNGLSDDLIARADGRIRIPMRAGVSSLNLATSVSAVLFAWRLAAEEQ